MRGSGQRASTRSSLMFSFKTGGEGGLCLGVEGSRKVCDHFPSVRPLHDRILFLQLAAIKTSHARVPACMTRSAHKSFVFSLSACVLVEVCDNFNLSIVDSSIFGFIRFLKTLFFDFGFNFVHWTFLSFGKTTVLFDSHPLQSFRVLSQDLN